jgi:hypothetical protein
MATSLLYSAPSTSYNSPWNVYLFKINDFAALSELVVGQEVTEITYLAAPPTEGGTGVGSILSFLYGSGGAPPFDLHLSPGPGRTLVGFIIIDSNGTLLQPDNGTGGGRGFVTFGDSELTPDEKNKECFDKLVWDKQCTFAKDVLKFVNQISFGYFKPEALECLKNEKRALEILNAYDTRDIENETTNYNVFTYKQIKKLLK